MFNMKTKVFTVVLVFISILLFCVCVGNLMIVIRQMFVASQRLVDFILW
jgi:hypothetical protein